MATAIPTPVDSIITARWIVPIEPRGSVFEHGAIAIHNGVIVAIGTADDIERQHTTEHKTQLDNHVLMPGLINAHGHAGMSLLRGYADDLALQEWLDKHIWPAEAKWVSADFVYDGARLAIAEMIKSGTTCFSDMYFFPEDTARAVVDSGIRCQITFPILMFPTNWARDADEYIDKGLAVHDHYRNHPLVRVGFGPHAPYTVADETFTRVAMLAGELDTPIQVHLHETSFEVRQSLEQYGKRPVRRLYDLGLLGPTTQCVHMTTVNEDDILLIKETGSHIIHCPESNLKLASGFCTVKTLLDAGINVALGTDSAASNNDLDMFGEMRTASLLAKAVSGDPTALDAHASLQLATLNGARALGIDHLTGSLLPGKQADMIAIRLDSLLTEPLYSVASQIAYTNSGSRVSDVWVGGKPLLKNSKLTTLHEPELHAMAREWGQRIHADKNA